MLEPGAADDAGSKHDGAGSDNVVFQTIGGNGRTKKNCFDVEFHASFPASRASNLAISESACFDAPCHRLQPAIDEQVQQMMQNPQAMAQLQQMCHGSENLGESLVSPSFFSLICLLTFLLSCAG